jgi:hypothetical protein
VTSPARTLLDVAAVAPAIVALVTDAFLVGRLITYDSLMGLVASPRAGVRALSDAIRGYHGLEDLPDSELEGALLRLVADHSLPPAELHKPVVGAPFRITPDLTFEGNVEVDGWSTHGTREAFERDRERDAVLSAMATSCCASPGSR